MDRKTAIIKPTYVREQPQRKPATVHTHTPGELCQCGCAPCEETCCTLDCLVQPRFFCGQLLTDADLNQLLEWAKAKFGLKRYLHGWGVVCGLEVGLDPQQPGSIVVHPGYAIDCCGRDIVACEPRSFDLTAACEGEACYDVDTTRWQGSPAAEKGVKIRANLQAEVLELARFDFGGLLSESVALDLYLHYATEGTDMLTGFAREGCGSAGQCEPSRVKETYTLSAERVAEPVEDRDYADWRERLRQHMAPYMDLRKLALAGRDDPRLRDWLLSWLKRYPLEEFGFVNVWVATVSDELLRADLARILFLLYLDRLIAWLRCGCWSCSPEKGVPVGRAWLSGAGLPGDDGCRVLYVAHFEPYRRKIRPEPCLPVRTGCANLGKYLWMSWDEAQDALRADGLEWDTATGKPIPFRDFGEESLALILEKTAFSYCRDVYNKRRLTPVLVEMDQPWGVRVAGFYGGEYIVEPKAAARGA